MVIDTNIFIEHLRAKEKSTTALYKLSDKPALYLSSVTVYELYMGAVTPEKERDIQNIINGLIVLPFTDAVAVKASQIYHHLKAIHQSVEFRDIFIAATCIVNKLPIVTLNKKHFKRIEGLQITA
ncbi:MAG: type II toxin-antitoxin system VapC family toxin [Bacteroidota bacterium]